MTAAPAFGVSGTATTGYVPTVQADGSIAWAAGGSAPVSSVFARTGAVVAGNADYLAVKTGGLTGATAAVRYVGGTASGAPASGTFSVGDFVNDQLGQVWVCVTAGSPGTWTNASKSRMQAAQVAAGFLSEAFPAVMITGTGAPVSQRVEGLLVGGKAGDVATGVMLRVAVAAAGSSPTTARVGLTDANGVVLALSNNLNAASNWVTGACNLPFSAPYTILADGGYYVCFVVNGVWGTTQPTVGFTSTTGSTTIFAGSSGKAALGFRWSSQTDLPAVGQSVTLTSTVVGGNYIALY